jgi:hypothetical protein
VGTIADAALSQVAFHLDRSGRVFDALFGRARDWDPPLLAWEGADLAQARVVARHLGARARTLEEMRLYASTWMGHAILTWETGPRDETPWRVDAGLKAAQTRRLRLVYDLGASGHEALGDAFARYLVWRQAGTRLTWPIDRSYVDPLRGASLGRLHEARFDWAKAAAELLAPASARGALRLALGKSIEAQTPEDALVAYAFSAYVFEGHADAAHPFALRMGGGQGLAAGVPALGDGDEGDEPPAEARPDLDAAFLATLGWRVEQVERRLERWCREAGP